MTALGGGPAQHHRDSLLEAGGTLIVHLLLLASRAELLSPSRPADAPRSRGGLAADLTWSSALVGDLSGPGQQPGAGAHLSRLCADGAGVTDELASPSRPAGGGVAFGAQQQVERNEHPQPGGQVAVVGGVRPIGTGSVPQHGVGPAADQFAGCAVLAVVQPS